MATELGKAYVQIIPSAEGISGKISKVLGNESADAGKKAGISIAGAIGKAIAVVGIGKMLSDTIFEGAELQQNLGGTEAVFGKFAENIQSTASEAYKNMGLSASEYMSTANKMASLFQGSGIEQSKSLDLTTNAMQRAADVASVMGIDTSMAMESIAGAAKGNFTMMDNLGVAMNATTLQAYALEKGLNFKWNTASNAEKTELAMQMFMERTSQYAGNFARESEETISGSLGAMKAAAKDLMGNLTLGRDISTPLQNLIKTSITLLTKNLLPAIVQIVKSIPVVIVTIIKDGLPLLINSGITMIKGFEKGIINGAIDLYNSTLIVIDKMKEKISSKLPDILNNGVEIISKLATGILSNIPTVVSSIGNVVSMALSALLPALPLIWQKGFELLSNLAQGFISNLPEIASASLGAILQIVAVIGNNLPSILQKGIEIIFQLAAGIIKAIPQLISKLPEVFTSVKTKFSEFDWISIGSNIISGIINGLKNGIGSLISAAVDVAASAYNSIKNFLGIKSPSTETTYLGNMVSEGLAKGILGEKSLVKNAMLEVGKVTTDTLESQISLGLLDYSKNRAGLSVLGKETTSGFSQAIYVNSPKQLDPSEIARQTRIATRQMALTLSMGK